MSGRTYTLALMLLPVVAVIGGRVALAGPTREIHVAPDAVGGDGSSLRPYGSLEQARDAVRRELLEATGTIQVVVHGGRYELNAPLELTSDDSGTGDVTVVWTAAEGETPEISGGVVVQWVPAGEDWRAHLREDVPDPEFVRVGDKWADPSRYPDGDGLNTNSYLLVPRAVNRGGTNLTAMRAAQYGKRCVEGGWSLILDGDLDGLPTNGPLRTAVRKIWSVARARIVAVDRQAKEARLEDGFVSGKHMNLLGGAGDFKKPFLCWFEAHPAFVRHAGQWAWDADKRDIIYRPRAGEEPARTPLIVARADCLLKIHGRPDRPVARLRFRGLTFRDSAAPMPAGGVEDLQACRTYRDFILDRSVEANSNERDLVTLPAAVLLTHARDVEFENCRFLDLGGHGLAVSSGCATVRVARCTFERIGAIPLIVGTAELFRNASQFGQLVHNVIVESNRISQGGRVHAGAPGIWVGLTQGCRIACNHLHDLPYTGVSVGWDWTSAPRGSRDNLIASNLIERVMLYLTDGGGIYCLGGQPGGRITGNLIRDIPMPVLPSVGVRKGVYLDEGSIGWTVTDNVVVRVWMWSLFLHKAGPKNLIENNAFGVFDGAMGRVSPPYNTILALKKAGDCPDRVKFGENSALADEAAVQEAESAILPKVGLGTELYPH